MDEWRTQLRSVVAQWGLSPEEQAGIVEELEEHLEQELAELQPLIGTVAAHERLMAQVGDPALRSASVRARHRAAPSVAASRVSARGWSAIGRDVRYGWRSLAASPGTTALATIALALGIGLTTVMFSIIYGVLLRGLPYEQGNRIAMVMEANPSHHESELALSMHDFFAYRTAQRSFEAFGAFSPITINISGDERPERIDAARVTAAALDLTRVHPLLGRTFRVDDESRESDIVAVLSYSLWRDRYASDSGVVGRAVRVNGQSATVVGVMPDGFGFPNATKLWVPLRLDPAAVPWGTGARVNGVGRLRGGVTLDQAKADLTGIALRIESEHRQSNEGVRVVVQPFVHAVLRTQVYALLYAMFAAVGLVFLVACTNVANLFLARAAHRTKEVAVRRALGASSAAIARQFLVESVVLSTLAAVLAAIVAQAGIAAFRVATAGAAFPFWTDVRLHPQVFLFIAAAALLASFFSGLLPALTAARTDITEVLKDQSLGSSSLRGARLGRALVVFELTLSSALLVVAALTTRSFMNLRALDPGFNSRSVLTARVTLSVRDSARRADVLARLASGIAQLPGAAETSLSTNVPGTGWSETNVAVEGHTYTRRREHGTVGHLSVTPGFFKTFGIAMARGRSFTEQDRAGALPVAVVNQRFVDDNFPNADPVGRRINLSPDDTIASWVTIVGVMPNLYAATPGLSGWPPEVLTPFNGAESGSASIAIRTSRDPTAMAQPLRALVASLDPDLPVYSLAPMSRVLTDSMWPTRIFGGLFVVFGIVALALASIGLYAVLAFSVSRREREMGIRMALGAAAADVARLVLKEAGVQLTLGVTLGVLIGVAGARLGRSALFGVQPSDPVTIAVVVATLAITGLLACVVPALRATRADPVRSLRAD